MPDLCAASVNQQRELAAQLRLLSIGPTVPAIYRVAYYPSGYNEPAGKDELFVQES
ncbi:MAG TPA: hypothetical protein VFY60_08095 [Pyrinomonadaceae bacterium]|nr:hypothetical protein [Pyrinomonadaceae bacterium]